MESAGSWTEVHAPSARRCVQMLKDCFIAVLKKVWLLPLKVLATNLQVLLYSASCLNVITYIFLTH